VNKALSTPASQPITVLHLIHSLAVGGAECLTLDISVGLKQTGRYHPVVCAWRRGGPVEQRLARAEIDTHIPPLRRRSVWLLPLLLFDVVMMVRTITRLVRDHQVRIIHAHLNDSAFLGLLVGWFTGCPVLSMEHSTYLLPDTIKRGTWKYRFRHLLMRWTLRRVDRVIAVSPGVQQVIIQEIGIPSERTAVVTNGIALPVAPAQRDRGIIRRELNIADDAVVLLCVGRVVESKGQPALLRILSRLYPTNPHLRLLLVGEGPAEVALRSEAERLQLSDALVFAGRRDDVGDVLAAADVFVTASHFEGVSLAVLEAMARGLPVVSYDCPGNREVLSGGAGAVVPLHDEVAFADAIVAILADSIVAQRQCERARVRVNEHYALSRAIRQIIELYESLLAERK
jgi:L-malate glycosyltransferase